MRTIPIVNIAFIRLNNRQHVRMAECLFGRYPSVRVQLEHTLQQIDGQLVGPLENVTEIAPRHRGQRSNVGAGLRNKRQKNISKNH